MTIIENRAAHRLNGRSDAPLQARALLSDESAEDGPARPAVVITASDEPEPADLSGRVADLPLLDGWIVDLSLRDERITVVTRTDVLCSAPLFLLPDGWIAAVAAQGLLAVVIRFGPDGPLPERAGVPTRAMREPSVLAARVPVCLS